MIKRMILLVALTLAMKSMFGQSRTIAKLRASAPYQHTEQSIKALIQKTFQDDYKIELESFMLSKDSSNHGRMFVVVSDAPQEELLKNSFLSNVFEYVEPDHIGHACSSQKGNAIPDDPGFHLQWYLYNDGTFAYGDSKPGADINVLNAWNITDGDSLITVAVLDSGIDHDLSEFENRLWRNINEIPDDHIDNDGNGYVDDIIGWDFINDDNNPEDDAGHGTAVTGILAANYNNKVGVAGIDQRCKILVCKVLDNNLTGYYSQWVKAIYYAVDNGARIINFSMAGLEPSKALQEAVQYAESKGVLIVAGMGNNNSDQQCFPAVYAETLAVGSTDPDDRRSKFFNGIGASGMGSNYGNHIDVVAPGNYIYTLSTNGLPSVLQGGTSMATPMVSGIASLLLAQDKTRSAKQLRSIIYHSAADLVGDPSEDMEGWDPYYGFGRVDAGRALSTDETGVSSENTLYLFPNPGRDDVTLYLIHGAPSAARVMVFNNMGKVMLTLNSETKRIINMNLELQSLASGLYFVRIQTTTDTIIERLYVVR